MKINEYRNKWTNELVCLNIPTFIQYLSTEEKNAVAKFINAKFYHHNPEINIENVLSEDELRFIKENPNLIYKSNIGAAYREINLQPTQKHNIFSNNPIYYFIAGILIVFILIYNLSKIDNTPDTNTTTPTEINTISQPEHEPKSAPFEEKESTTTCSICGKEFTGRGYHEVSEGQWELCQEPYQCQICSRQCGMIHNGKWNDILNEIDQNKNSSSNRFCKNCKFGVYRAGFCDLCGAATSEKVQEYKSRLPKCDLCNGTGIERPSGFSSESGRICPACDGSGHVNF
jgi:hypothetical protein